MTNVFSPYFLKIFCILSPSSIEWHEEKITKMKARKNRKVHKKVLKVNPNILVIMISINELNAQIKI